MASSTTGLIQGVEQEGGGAAGEGGGGGAAAAAPWLFSERDALDLMRLKKPLFLDSRFFSAASCRRELGPPTEERLRGARELQAAGPWLTHRHDEHMLMSQLSLEAELNDFLGEEVFQAFIQLPHDAVLLCFVRHTATTRLSLETEPRRTSVLM